MKCPLCANEITTPHRLSEREPQVCRACFDIGEPLLLALDFLEAGLRAVLKLIPVRPKSEPYRAAVVIFEKALRSEALRRRVGL